MKYFDLIEYQQDARACHTPKELFELWEEVCRQYDKGLIGAYELDEMKAVIWPNLHALTKLKENINQSFVAEAA